MTTNKVCGKCKFTDEFCASGDCPYDPDVLKKTEKINISEGNVKENNIFYRDCCDKFIDYVKKSHNKQDLTEQWKKGELEKGKKYWCKLQDGTSEICYLWLQTNHFTFLTGYQSRCLPDEDIAEVLAPVPSYEEWIGLGNKYDSLQEQIFAQALIYLENGNLKKLLKECEHIIEDAWMYSGMATPVRDDIISKINEALK